MTPATLIDTTPTTRMDTTPATVMDTTPSTSIGNLPAELSRLVIEQVDDRDSLTKLYRVSKYYRELVEPVIYERISLHYDERYRVQNLVLTLLDRPNLAVRVKSFKCHTPLWGTDSREGSEDMRMLNALWERFKKIRATIFSHGDAYN
jgi:hypothetical protein